MSAPLSGPDRLLRSRIYAFFVAQAHPPSVSDMADSLGWSVDDVRQTFHRLHEGHAIFLEPGSDHIRMANPLSAVPTRFAVESGGHMYWANCAWDSLGIPAMLHQDADITAHIPGEAAPVRYSVRDGELDAPAWFVYFPLPVRQWYDDLIHT